MARGGYKFFDTDAHVGPYADVLEPYMSAADKEREAALIKQLGGVDLANGSDRAWIFDFSVGARFPIDVDVPYNKRALCVRRVEK